MGFNLDDYEPVEDRLKRFYADHEDGRVLTTLMSSPDNIATCVFRADLYIGELLKSQGWAYERDGEGYVNKTSHLENCETSAIGRALANAGYQGSKRPSREEMEKVERNTKDPKEGWDDSLAGLKATLDQAVLDTVITAEDRGKTIDKVDGIFTTADLEKYKQAVMKHLDKKRTEEGLF